MNINLFLIMLLMLNMIFGIVNYFLLYKKRKLFSDRYGMIITICSTGVLSLNLAIILHFLLPIHLVLIMSVSTAIGGIIGILFGSLVKFQSLVAGYFYGTIGGIMGTMFGAVIENPSLCGLPASYLNSVTQNIITFTLFGTVLVMTTFVLVYYSLRV
ncbi:hypothetical protein [Bacillus sp. FJAT-45037]|uniref:hypothetical protein n=1 Tax=Bacillus sp. FJAT-45037 TaxID=2011007 RepID=UPI001E2A8034|nr:hypothetical protein [Bacillus sp. FJAT-45037]